MNSSNQRLALRFKVFVVIALALLTGALVYVFLPKPDLANYQSYSTVIFDRHDRLLRISLAQDDRYRLYTPIEDIAAHLQRATILYEDQNYYEHSGVDYLALLRAFWQTYVLQERRIGASTIVMQVARLRWHIPSNTVNGKVQQIFRALQLARHYSKQELLEAYLNLAPYGGNIEGIGAASLIYFDKPASALSFAEALTLAVVPQNPNMRNPSKAVGIAAIALAKERLIERWLASSSEAQINENQQLLNSANMPLVVRSSKNLPYYAPHFVEYLLSQQAQTFALNNELPGRQQIKGTIDLNLQNRMEEVLQSYISQNQSRGFNNASALLLNTKTMHIEAMIGSADFNNLNIHGQVNGTTAKRSPGSALKPFVYGLAIDAGLIHPMTMLKDLPKKYSGFAPENFGKGFVGPIAAQDALIKSRNVPAVELQSQLLDKQHALANKENAEQVLTLYEFLQKAGISELRGPDFYGLALALGGSEVTMLELLELYAMIANLGVHKKVVSTYGVSEQANTNDTQKEQILLSPEASYLVFDMLSKNPNPHFSNSFSARNGLADKPKVAWKTGTSWAFRDAWAVALSGDYALAVWIGNFDGQGNNAFVGRSAAGPLLFNLLDVVNSESSTPFDDGRIEQLNLKWIDICKTTGDLDESECPDKSKTLFIPGVSPIKSTHIYRKVWVDNVTGLRRCDKNAELARQKVVAFWPTEFQSLFVQAGIYIEQPPRFMSDCDVDDIVEQGEKPTISSPLAGVKYIVEESLKNTVSIPLKASVDAQASYLYWFSNGQFIGSTNLTQTSLGAPLIWQAKPGEYKVQVSDDLGRSAILQVQVQSVK